MAWVKGGPRTTTTLPKKKQKYADTPKNVSRTLNFLLDNCPLYLIRQLGKRTTGVEVSGLHAAATHEVVYPQFVFFGRGALSPGSE